MEVVRRINGDKVNLRIVTKADALTIYRNIADKDISRFTHIPDPYKLEDAYDFIRFTHRQRRRKTGYHFGLENKDDGEIIGGINLENICEVNRKGEIGYWLAKPYWGKGIMVEAINLMLEFCFTKVKLHRVQAHVFPDNAGSIRVLEKTGFKREGLIREGFTQRGIHVDVYLYAILEDEWAKRDMPPDPHRST